MATRNIRINGDPILRKNSKTVNEVTPRLNELIDDMTETLAEANGVGLAAVQVGVLKKLCIINIAPDDMKDPEDETVIPEEEDGYKIHTNGVPLVIINPEVTADGDETQTGNEGCLSAPGKWGQVTRPMKVTLKAFDRELKPYELKAQGLFARAICHETDHMYGKMYLDIVEGDVYSEEDMEEEQE